MPMPGFVGNLMRRFGVVKPMNTLDSEPGRTPEPVQYRFSDAPAPKRQKNALADARPRRPVEDIADAEQDVMSKTENHGSQASFAHSVSPGVSEYQAVEAFSGRGRSNRRRRASPSRHSHGVSVPSKRGKMRCESIEDFDELDPRPQPQAHQQRVARLRMPSVRDVENARAPMVNLGDAADRHIIGNRNRKRPNLTHLARGKKRPNHEISDDGDELAVDLEVSGISTANDRPRSADSASHQPPSLSRRGDMNRTNWARKPGPLPDTGVLVQSAVCQPKFRYLAAQNPCYLRRLTPVPELRAFTENGREAEPYAWLRITEKANVLFYHPESSFIKIKQRMDQSSPAGHIGSTMVIKLSNSSDALWVTDWVRKNLKTRVEEENSDKLLQIYDKMNQEISLAPARSRDRRPSNESLRRPPLPMLESRTTGPLAEQQDSRPPSTRTPIRQQMKVSLQTPSISHSQPMNGLVPSVPRSLRSRLVGNQAFRFDVPQSPVIRRWTEEHPGWERHWKMPLMFRRTTVDKDDIPRLDEGQCLNDNLIGFGLRYLFDEFSSRHKDLNQRVYLHNSFFYEKLKAGRGINYDGVKSWTAKVDLLSYDYIVVPVNEHFHWWVAIICNPGKLDPDSRRPLGETTGTPKGKETLNATQPDQDAHGEEASDVEMTDVAEKPPMQPAKEHLIAERHRPLVGSPRDVDIVRSDIVDLASDDKNASIDLTRTGPTTYGRKPRTSPRRHSLDEPRIITLDSLGSSHSLAVSHLKQYLLAEFEHKRNKIIAEVPGQLGMKAVNIPEQNNLCDCGVYLLGYVQEFVKDPDQFIQTLLRRETPDWQFDPTHLRELWRETIVVERDKYQRKQEEMQRKREASAARQSSNGASEPDGYQSRAHSEAAYKPKARCDSTLGGSEEPASAKAGSLRKGINEVADSGAKEASDGWPRSANEQPHPPEPKRARSAQHPSSQQETPDEVVLLSSHNDAVLPSIEVPDVEEVRRQDDEPQFIPKLPTSSPRPRDQDHLAEVSPAAFYSSSAKAKRVSTARASQMSSPGVGRQARTGRTHPAHAHTESGFVVDESDIPVVQRAELVRQSDTIDLTD